jgi:dipeptidyl aminopeptidase/acylaminoacyl peptidase
MLTTLLSLAALTSAPNHGLTIEDMLAMQRISEPDVSPDGKLAAFTVRDTDYESNRGRTDVWLANVDGSSVRRLTTNPENDSSPQFSPDGKWVYFTSTRTGSSQVWRISIAGSEAEQVTKLPLDVNGFVLFPDGKRVLVAMDVYPDAKTLEETQKRDDEKSKSKVKAMAFDQLLFRHWDTWEDGKYSHLFVVDGTSGDKATDITPGQLTDSPTHPFGGTEEMSIAPDGKSIAFVARVGKGSELAWNTNSDIFLVTANGAAWNKPVDVTADNKAYEFSPSFSPDGKSIAFLRMMRPGYESDRNRIAVLDVASKKVRVLTEAWDRSPGDVAWSKDGKTLWATADDVGNHALFAVDVASGSVKTLVAKGEIGSPKQAGDRVLFAKDTLTSPTELYSMKPDGSDVKEVTKLNAERTSKIAWGQYEQFSFTGAHGEKVYGFAMHPANHDGKSKVPVAFLIHGGPQGSFGDHFHYRWNPEVFAGHGYGVVFVDFHGSTGYGQAFTDAINGDWGGAPFEDLMKGLDAALAKYPWLDGNRSVALGASFGGYMINWINGHTDRFKALVCHDGNLDEKAAYFATEELWFPEWEHKGLPWENPQGYDKDSPIQFVKNWKTPTLVVHGGNDFRVVDTEGMSTFTALQRKGIKSRLLFFPDENHWVLKPQNSKRWHDEVFAWIDQFAAPAKK